MIAPAHRAGNCNTKRRIVRAMKKSNLSMLSLSWSLMMAPLSFAQAPSNSPQVAPGADPAPAPTPDQASYTFGLLFGAQLNAAGLTGNEIVTDAVNRGMQAGLSGTQVTPADQAQLQAYVRATAATMALRNEAAAKEFLARNAHEKGVVTTASGLQYKIISAGDKKAPLVSATDKVTVDYRGKLLDGTEFDSSYSRGVPIIIQADRVIKGWQEALIMMRPGAKWQLFIPPDLAYGSSPKPKIPAGSLLIFDVNLLSATRSDAPPAAPPGTPH